MTKITETFVDAALELADNGTAKIGDRERELFGLSSTRLRSLINNLCHKEDTNYLELGVYKGATLISAMYGNPKTKAVGVENYRYDEREPKKLAAEGTIWENIKSQLNDNLKRYQDPDMAVNIDNLTIIESDFQTVDLSKHPKFDVCFFDINPASVAEYDAFFENIVPNLKTESVLVFSNYSNDKNAKELDAAFTKHSDKLEITWKRHRISSGLSDATQYYSGILVVGVKRNLTTKVAKTTAGK